MVINLRQNKNDDSTAYGKYFAEVDSKEPLNLKGLAKHMTEHGKISSKEMCELVLGELVSCMTHLLREGQPVKLDGFGTFSPSVDGQKLGKANLADAVAGGAECRQGGSCGGDDDAEDNLPEVLFHRSPPFFNRFHLRRCRQPVEPARS